MAERRYIEKNPDLRPSQDYGRLKAEGIRHIERLARNVWTDYNIHDPGITILELLCYAITDLGYRIDHDIKDLLTRYSDGEHQTVGLFHQALQTLTSRPVTFGDLRKLLIDIEGVRNAWIEKHRSVVYCFERKEQALVDCSPELRPSEEANPPLNGLYDVYIDLDKEVRDEESDKHITVVGLVDDEVGRGRYIAPSTRGILFDVQRTLTIEAVHVYAEAPGRVQVRLLDDEENVLNRRAIVVDTAKQKTRVPLDFDVEPGTGYRLDAWGSEVELFRTTGIQYDFEVADLIQLTAGVHGQRVIDPYYFFYAWEIGYTVPPEAEAPERVRLGRRDNVGAPGAYIHPEEKGIAFELMNDITIEKVSVYADRPGTVRIVVLDEEDQEVASVQGEVTEAGVKTPIDLGVALPGGREYRMLGGETELELYRNTEIDYPFTAAGVVHLTEGLPGEHRYYFFYDWEITYARRQVQTAGLLKGDVYERVKRRLLANRNLGEDFVDICTLKKEDIAVCADIEVTADMDVDEVLADILYRLGEFITPPVRFYTLQEMLDRGRTPSEIFEGPVLNHGFIDDSEFQQIQRREELHVSDLVQVIMDVPGVTAIREISVLSFLDDAVHRHEEWVLPLEPDRISEFTVDRSKIIFYKNDLPYYANRGDVRELLQEKKLEDRPTKLRERANNFPVPVGEDRQIEDYYPIQNEMPAAYMVGNNRPPASESPRRKAQSRQLKAYMLFFEQLLANYLSQLANVHELFSWDAGSSRTYFTQEIENVADIEDLYVDRDGRDLQNTLESIIEDETSALARKDRFLSHLISRFAEQFSEYSLLMYNHYKATREERGVGDAYRVAASERIAEDKRAFLADYPRLSSRRGTAFNYSRPERFDNLSGYRERVYRLLGFQEVERRRLAGDLLAIRGEEGEDGQEWWFEMHDEGGRRLFESIRCREKSSAEVLLDTALNLGARKENYDLNDTGDAYELFRPCRGEGEDDVIGRTTSTEALDDVHTYFRKYSRAEGFHVVEHILLRKRTRSDPFLPVQLTDQDACDCPTVRDPYSFRVSVLLPSWPRRFQDLKFRSFVEKTLRMEAPAHVYVRICWINHEQMKQFERRHDAWLENLAGLTRWLGGCRERTSEAGQAALSLSGERPLPAIHEVGEDADHPRVRQLQEYRDSLEALFQVFHSLDNVHPIARLHDCAQERDSETPQVTLNNTNLGTF